MKLILSALSAVVLAGCSVFGGKAADEPPYRLAISEPPFEIREYEAIVVATTKVDAPYQDAISTGFGRLFDYISGANTGAAKIAMTAPVLTEEASTKIAMTAPVITEADGAGTTVMFVLPEAFTLDTAPQPTDPTVTLSEIGPRRVAVARFQGFLTETAIENSRTDLLEWLVDRGEPADGPWQAAGYNPPWTVPSLRRNEVLITLQR
ncbi:MAG: heme-binding protein [Pseudomonadota bacterium]